MSVEGQKGKIRELGLFESFSSKSNDVWGKSQIPRVQKDIYHKKYREKCMKKNWSEWICIVKKAHND